MKAATTVGFAQLLLVHFILLVLRCGSERMLATLHPCIPGPCGGLCTVPVAPVAADVYQGGVCYLPPLQDFKM